MGVLEPCSTAHSHLESAVIDSGLVGVHKVKIGIDVAVARLLDGGVFHQRTNAVIAGILEVHAVPAAVAAFVGGQ